MKKKFKKSAKANLPQQNLLHGQRLNEFISDYGLLTSNQIRRKYELTLKELIRLKALYGLVSKTEYTRLKSQDQIKPFNPMEGRFPVRIDPKTVVLVKIGSNTEEVIARYAERNLAKLKSLKRKKPLKKSSSCQE